MSYFLVRWTASWADEMDVDGFKIFTPGKWEDFKSKLKNRKEQFEIFVGSNESIDYKNGNQLLKELDVTEITDEEYHVIKKLIGTKFGHNDFIHAAEY
jgi:hypothetical protein